MRPKKRNETLSQYADAVIEDFSARAAAMTPSVDVAWKTIFDALTVEGRHMALVGPAAVVIYQRYLALAVTFLHDYPDDEKHEELVRLVRNDLGHHASVFSKMKACEEGMFPEGTIFTKGSIFKGSLFTNQERSEGTLAYRRILNTLNSFA